MIGLTKALAKEIGKINITVFLGASLALIIASAIGVLAGSIISRYINEKQLHYLAGIGFISIGVWTMIKAYKQ